MTHVAMAILSIIVTPFAAIGGERDVLYQVSTINALLEGVYDGEMTYGDVMEHGAFGLGTFNGLDGEMVQLEGSVYQIKTDGKAYVVKSETKTPFAMTTWFEADVTGFQKAPLGSEELQARLDAMIVSKNLIYAVKITGSFDYLKLRSVPAQSKPYPKLKKVIENQAVFEHSKAIGAIVGFRIPGSLKGANSPGYHFHFISEDRKYGGHVLALRTAKVKIELDQTRGFMMILPADQEFLEADESSDTYKPMESKSPR